MFKNPLAFPERHQRDTQVEVDVGGLLTRLAVVRQMRQGGQRLHEVRCRFSHRRAGICLGAGLPEISQGFSPYLSPRCMMREPLDLLDQPIRI